MSRYVALLLAVVALASLPGCGCCPFLSSSKGQEPSCACECKAAPKAATLPVKFVAAGTSRIALRPTQGDSAGTEAIDAGRYRIVDVPLGSPHAVRIELADGTVLVGSLTVSKKASRESHGIVPLVISNTHVIKPALAGKRVTYVVYERDRDTCEGPISPADRTAPYSLDQLKLLRADRRAMRRAATPASPASTIRSEAEARQRLAYYNTDSRAKRGYDPVVLDEMRAKRDGGGFLYMYDSAEEHASLARLENLSSRAVPADVWKRAAQGPNDKVRHILGCGNLPIEKAKLRGTIVLTLKLRKAD